MWNGHMTQNYMIPQQEQQHQPYLFIVTQMSIQLKPKIEFNLNKTMNIYGIHYYCSQKSVDRVVIHYQLKYSTSTQLCKMKILLYILTCHIPKYYLEITMQYFSNLYYLFLCMLYICMIYIQAYSCTIIIGHKPFTTN